MMPLMPRLATRDTQGWAIQFMYSRGRAVLPHTVQYTSSYILYSTVYCVTVAGRDKRHQETILIVNGYQ